MCAYVSEGREQVHTFVFRLTNDSACRHLWKCAVDHHVFFRLSHNTQSHSRSSLSSSSLFRRSWRSIQRHDSSVEVRRRDVHVKRRPSQRFAPRRGTVSTVNRRHDDFCTSTRSTTDVTDTTLRSSTTLLSSVLS